MLLLQFQTTNPKSCFMRPNGGILAPNESIIATGNVEIVIPVLIVLLQKELFWSLL